MNHDVTDLERSHLISARDAILAGMSTSADNLEHAGAALVLAVAEGAHINRFHREDIRLVSRIVRDVQDYGDGPYCELIRRVLRDASRILDRVLDECCPHEPASWTATPLESGEMRVICQHCDASWIAPDGAGIAS